jgi:phosphomannomutase/phosphoglucomutase
LKSDLFPHHIFRKYDIRGAYGLDLTEEVVFRTAGAFADLCRERSGKDRPVVVIGMDARLHSPQLRDALASGLVEAGCSWVDIGLCPTPLTYFSAYKLEVDAFAMVTGSHNPPEDNGFKLGIGLETIHSGDMVLLGNMASADVRPVKLEKAEPTRKVDIIAMYQGYVLEAFSGLRRDLEALGGRFEVVVDSGNGTAGIVFPKILEKIGVKVHELYSEPDGTFPNHHPDPTLPEALEGLKAEILRTGSRLGISFDGDADRIGILDEKGDVIWGDMLLLILGRDIIQNWREEGSEGEPPLVISEVKASQILYDGILKAGGRVEMWKTGHSLIKARMKETGASIAGEMSGHLFFADRFFGFDDALYGALRILEVYIRALLNGTCERFSELLRDIPDAVSTPEIRFPCEEAGKFRLVEMFARSLGDHMESSADPAILEVIDIDGVRARFDGGWGLLRASNTQPVLVMRFEGTDTEKVEQFQKFFNTLLEKASMQMKANI